VEQAILQAYEAGAAKLHQSLASLTGEDLRQPPAPQWNSGAWSIQQVVLHIVDADGVIAERMKRIIAEDNPTLLAFDENRWTAALHYEDQSVVDALQIFELSRRQMLKVFAHLPDSAFQRFGTHNTAGKKTLSDLIAFAVDHLDHHVQFIHAKRIKMGKEMW